MRTRQTGFPLHDEVRVDEAGVLGGPGDVVAAELQRGGLLGVKDVGVAEGRGGVDVVDCD
jgi:hypothetical protein